MDKVLAMNASTVISAEVRSLLTSLVALLLPAAQASARSFASFFFRQLALRFPRLPFYDVAAMRFAFRRQKRIIPQVRWT
jgi:hypothetical protein